MAISDPPFSIPVADGGPDDLPRTLRREREARERQAREMRERAAAAAYHSFGPRVSEGMGAPPGVVTRLDLPFLHLAAFFLKAVFAAVPALFVLGFLLWGVGHVLLNWFPDLVKMQILILFPPG